jgi:uncharacterized membrane protein
MGKSHSSGVESTAAVFHHPLHPMAIAFPVATLMAAPLADLAARATDDPFWRRAGRWLLIGGLTSGVAASLVGLVDYLAVKEVRRLPSAHVHAAGNTLAMVLAAANLLRRPSDDSRSPDALDLGLSLTTVALLGATAWLGGELSYRHGVGVIAEDSPTASQDIGRIFLRRSG